MPTLSWPAGPLSGATNFIQPRLLTAALPPNASPTLPPAGATETPAVPPKRRLSAWNWLPPRLRLRFA